MILNFRGKCIKDTETAAETILLNNEYITNPPKINKISSRTNITTQQNLIENFESFTEKRI